MIMCVCVSACLCVQVHKFMIVYVCVYMYICMCVCAIVQSQSLHGPVAIGLQAQGAGIDDALDVVIFAKFFVRRTVKRPEGHSSVLDDFQSQLKTEQQRTN